MKVTGFFTATTLRLLAVSLLVGSAALVYAQDEKQQDNHPAAQQDDARPQPKQSEAQPRDDNAKPRQDEAQPRPEAHSQDHPEQPRQGQTPANRQAGNDHPGGDHGGRIPDDQFRAHFGRQHEFRAQGVIVVGHPEFQYSGYTFQLAQPWPGEWAYTDDCYIDYIDGEYFLIDLAHPGVRLALLVVM